MHALIFLRRIPQLRPPRKKFGEEAKNFPRRSTQACSGPWFYRPVRAIIAQADGWQTPVVWLGLQEATANNEDKPNMPRPRKQDSKDVLLLPQHHHIKQMHQSGYRYKIPALLNARQKNVETAVARRWCSCCSDGGFKALMVLAQTQPLPRVGRGCWRTGQGSWSKASMPAHLLCSAGTSLRIEEMSFFLKNRSLSLLLLLLLLFLLPLPLRRLLLFLFFFLFFLFSSFFSYPSRFLSCPGFFPSTLSSLRASPSPPPPPPASSSSLFKWMPRGRRPSPAEGLWT